MLMPDGRYALLPPSLEPSSEVFLVQRIIPKNERTFFRLCGPDRTVPAESCPLPHDVYHRSVLLSHAGAPPTGWFLLPIAAARTKGVKFGPALSSELKLEWRKCHTRFAQAFCPRA